MDDQFQKEMVDYKDYSYGNISLSVGYDQDKKAFFGDGRYTVAQVLDASGCKAIEEEHISVNGHPILLLKVQEKKSGKIFYTIYIAMMLESNNIFIAYRPPVNNPTEGAYVWDQLKKSIRESNNAAQTTGKPATGR